MKISKPSIQSLLIEMRFSGQLLATGTAFVAISPRGPVLITTRHNVTGCDQDNNRPISKTLGLPNEVLIHHNCAKRLGEWTSKVEPLFSGDRPLWIEHPTIGPRADFVALPLTQLDGIDLFPYTLGVGDPAILVAPAEVVSVVGFPFGLSAGGYYAIWATGFVASEPVVDYDALPLFLIDCRSRHGQSGSAVIAHRSGGAVETERGTMVGPGAMTRFLGIYSGRINTESDLGFVWKAAAIEEMVKAVGRVG